MARRPRPGRTSAPAPSAPVGGTCHGWPVHRGPSGRLWRRNRPPVASRGVRGGPVGGSPWQQRHLHHGRGRQPLHMVSGAPPAGGLRDADPDQPARAPVSTRSPSRRTPEKTVWVPLNELVDRDLLPRPRYGHVPRLRGATTTRGTLLAISKRPSSAYQKGSATATTPAPSAQLARPARWAPSAATQRLCAKPAPTAGAPKGR